MRKFIPPCIGALLLFLSCNKQATQSSEPELTEPAAVFQRQCASEEVLLRQIAEDPERGRYLEELEQKTQAYKGRQGQAFRSGSLLYIPVVVHVVLQNPSLVTDAQVQTQIDVLNRDYNAANGELSNSSVYLAGYPYSNVANLNIQFYASSIVRKQTTTASFGTNDAVKKSTQGGDNPVSPTTMLNLWVCNLSSGLLGYAQFPGGSSATDGVVIDYQAFGTSSTGYSLYPQFNLGRTATHEIGHWLNLRHIWGDRRCGDDLVADTPQHDDANGGCPGANHRSKCSGRPLEQWMNYMDYTDDACMYMFSGGQKTRMDAAIDNSRQAYFSLTK